jgi:hypothetical protein
VYDCECKGPEVCRAAIDDGGAPICIGNCCVNPPCFGFGESTCMLSTTTHPDGSHTYSCGCTTSTEACCRTDGSCRYATADACTAIGGQPKGAGSVCLGDGDANGTDDACECTCQLYGDVHPLGSPAGNCSVNLDDVLCLIDGFGNPLVCPGADIHPCGGNNVIDLDDVLAVLSAFGGAYACPHPCPP